MTASQQQRPPSLNEMIRRLIYQGSLDVRDAANKFRRSGLEADQENLDYCLDKLNASLASWEADADRLIREQWPDHDPDVPDDPTSEDDVHRFAVGDEVRHRASGQSAIVMGCQYRCVKHRSVCMGVLNGWKDCDLVPVDVYTLGLGFGVDTISECGDVLEKAPDQKGMMPIAEFRKRMVDAVCDALDNVYLDEEARESIASAVSGVIEITE